jgi:hypothetical protein
VPTCADWASRQAGKPLHVGQIKMTQNDTKWHNMTHCFNCFNCFCSPREPLSFEQCHHDDPRGAIMIFVHQQKDWEPCEQPQDF